MARFFLHVLSSMVAASHMWLLNIWNVESATKELNSLF